MVDKELLDKKMLESGYKTGYIAEQLGVTRSALCYKRRGLRPFRAAEIYVLCNLLNLTQEEKKKIFFAQQVN